MLMLLPGLGEQNISARMRLTFALILVPTLLPLPTARPSALMKTLAFDVAAAFGVPLLVLCVAAFAGNIVQHRIVFTTEFVKPQLSRISPMAGFARLFSKLQHAARILEKEAHHRPEQEEEEQEPDQDRQRQPDKEHLNLRHQSRQYAKPDVEQKPKNDERRGKLNAEAKSAGDRFGNERRGVARGRQLAGLEQGVTVVERRDHEVMHVGCEKQRDLEQRQEVADDHALLPLGRIDSGDKAKAEQPARARLHRCGRHRDGSGFDRMWQ